MLRGNYLSNILLSSISSFSLTAHNFDFFANGQSTYQNYAEVNEVLMPWRKRYRQMKAKQWRRSIQTPHVGAKQKAKYAKHPERWSTN